MAEPFLSEIRIMSFVFAPKGWALCNGQLLPINQNQALVLAAGHDVRRRRAGQLRASRPARAHADSRRQRAHAGRERRRAGAHAFDRGAADAYARGLSAIPVLDDATPTPTDGLLAKARSNVYTRAANLVVALQASLDARMSAAARRT